MSSSIRLPNLLLHVYVPNSTNARDTWLRPTGHPVTTFPANDLSGPSLSTLIYAKELGRQGVRTTLPITAPRDPPSCPGSHVRRLKAGSGLRYGCIRGPPPQPVACSSWLGACELVIAYSLIKFFLSKLGALTAR